jgi:CheY-like chemotaxis protein
MRLSVLIVDDNSHMRTLVATILRSAGCKDLVEASDGAEALYELRQRHFDLAIVDYRMDPLDGIEFTRLVRQAKDSPAPHLPIVMMSGFTERAVVLAAKEAGVSAFLAKPVSARTMLSHINRAMESTMASSA